MSETSRVPANVAGKTATRVVVPRTMAELQELVREPSAETLVPVGGGTQLELGNPVEGDFAVLSLQGALGGEPSHEPEDMTVEMPAGVTLAQLEEVLARRGQFLPIDPPLAPQATIGGVLASGASGPLRTRYGPPRDFLLGMSALRSDGALVKAGGRVVKNVTGYDLMRLWSGSLGTLGLFTRVALRAVPRPDWLDWTAAVDGVAEGADLAERLLRADVRPLALDILVEGGSTVLFARIEPPNAVRARAILPSPSQASTTACYEACRDLGFRNREALTVRAMTLPSDVATLAQTLSQLGPSALVARPLPGMVRATWTDPFLLNPERFGAEVTAIRTRLMAWGGSLTVERMPSPWRRHVETWGQAGPAVGLMRRTKAEYDPHGRFNRGRFVGGI